MIDIESEVFATVAKHVRETFPSIYMVGEYVPAPPSFPCVNLLESSNEVFRKTRDSSSGENHAEVMYTANVYSNKASGKKTECKQIMQLIDEKMESMGFTRIMCQPMDNLADGTIYRMVGRWRAIVDHDHHMYRR